jgi:endonuclease/exonuclease/phosphatase family metal-dependent hydrolase
LKNRPSKLKKFFLGLGLLLLAILVMGYFFLAQGAGVPAHAKWEGEALRPPVISESPQGVFSTEISVLTYNIAGLAWPVACGKKSRQTDANGERIPIACDRAEAIVAIGDTFAEFRQQGKEPDIVFLQEAFIAASEEIVQRGGYTNWVTGPGREDVGPEYSERASQEFLLARALKSGEKSGKRLSAGLLIASNFPISESFNHAFYQWECAGFDCLANKGVAMARIAIPGVPGFLEVVTSHFNSKGASGVSLDRSFEAHKLQLASTREFLKNTADYSMPGIWGGDLNMRHSDERLENFVKGANKNLNEVSSYCVENPDRCDIGIDWQSDTPWYDSQDLQGWDSGDIVKVEPVRVEQAFNEPVNGIMPSDHNGFLVTYRLSWSAQE